MAAAGYRRAAKDGYTTGGKATNTRHHQLISSWFTQAEPLDQFCNQFATVSDFHRATVETGEGSFE